MTDRHKYDDSLYDDMFGEENDGPSDDEVVSRPDGRAFDPTRWFGMYKKYLPEDQGVIPDSPAKDRHNDMLGEEDDCPSDDKVVSRPDGQAFDPTWWSGMV